MNYDEACKILDLPINFNHKILKQQYYLKALKYHPDKNKNTEESKYKFQHILEAYNYLSNIPPEKNINYMEILEKFINCNIGKNKGIDISKLLNNFISASNYHSRMELSKELFNCFSKEILIKINNLLIEYPDILHINKEILEKIKSLINEKIVENKSNEKPEKIIIVNPSLQNLINDDIYKLQVENETYLIPYWHDELIYETSYNKLIIQCEPILPDFINIDENNNIHFHLSTKINEILNLNQFEINIGNTQYTIPINKLYIKRYQIYTIQNEGIAVINTREIYNVEKRANIYIYINFIDII